MIIDTERLVSQSTYAKMINKSKQWVSQMVREGKVEHILVDGTAYIILDKGKKN